MDIQINEEIIQKYQAVFAVNEQAFKQEDESKLV